MALKLPPHSHCLECEEPIDEGETFCSEGCRSRYEERERLRKRKMMMFYLAAFILIMVVASISVFI